MEGDDTILVPAQGGQDAITVGEVTGIMCALIDITGEHAALDISAAAFRGMMARELNPRRDRQADRAFRAM
ncbi:MAG: hypothetical protein H0X36_00320 [Sphingomonadaceae bacterium]|nr:hypothetical protein [Sphingomonadaceae bacterium]